MDINFWNIYYWIDASRAYSPNLWCHKNINVYFKNRENRARCVKKAINKKVTPLLSPPLFWLFLRQNMACALSKSHYDKDYPRDINTKLCRFPSPSAFCPEHFPGFFWPRHWQKESSHFAHFPRARFKIPIFLQCPQFLVDPLQYYRNFPALFWRTFGFYAT